MRICDAHLHYGLPGALRAAAEGSPLRSRFPCYRTVQFDRMDDYEARFAEHGVEKSVLIPFVFRELDKSRENRLVLDCARQHPNRYFPYALLDEDDPSFLDENFRQIVGLKEHIVLHATELTGPRKEIFARLQEYGLIMLMHTRADRRVDYVAEIVRNFPRLKIQIAHMGRAAPEDVPFMLQVIEALRPYENVFFDTSTVRQPEVVSKAVNLTGAGRILYGSDFPFFLDRTEDIMAEQIQHVLRSGLTAEQQELIFSRNFDRLVTFGK